MPGAGSSRYGDETDRRSSVRWTSQYRGLREGRLSARSAMKDVPVAGGAAAFLDGIGDVGAGDAGVGLGPPVRVTPVPLGMGCVELKGVWWTVVVDGWRPCCSGSACRDDRESSRSLRCYRGGAGLMAVGATFVSSCAVRSIAMGSECLVGGFIRAWRYGPRR